MVAMLRKKKYEKRVILRVVIHPGYFEMFFKNKINVIIDT